MLGEAFAQTNALVWIDPDTSHRVIQISTEPNSTSLYFHHNTYSPRGDKMIFNSPGGTMAVDLRSLASGKPRTELVVSNAAALAMSFKAPEVYFRRHGTHYAAHVDSHAVRQIAGARVLAINCDARLRLRKTACGSTCSARNATKPCNVNDWSKCPGRITTGPMASQT
jgi:oligogalacturonide lyase